MGIEIADIRDYWGRLNAELQRLHERDCRRGNPDWIPEDVYAACLYGFAKLYACRDGFLVFKKEGSEFVIWFAISTRPGHSLMESYFADICRIAEQSEAKTMAFYTTRKGYDKVIEKGQLPGFHFQHSKYIKGI